MKDFRTFLLTIIEKCFSSKRTFPVHFVGGVAFAYKSFLEKAVKELNLNLGKVVLNLQDALVAYYGQMASENERRSFSSKVSRHSFNSRDEVLLDSGKKTKPFPGL